LTISKSLFFFFGLIFCVSSSFGQLSDLARIDFTIIPRGSESSTIQYDRLRALFNYPIALKKEGSYFITGLDYSNIHLRVPETSAFDVLSIEQLQLLDLNLGYTQKLKDDWRLAIQFKPGVSSNLTASSLSFSDIVFSGSAFLIKDKTKDETIKKPYRLFLGVSFSGNGGFPFPLPFVSYYRWLNEKWTYNIGIPKSNLQYHFSKKHRLKAFAQLDGFNSNIQNGMLVNGTTIAERVNLFLVVSGLQYEYHFKPHFELYFRGAYNVIQNARLRDGNRNEIIELGELGDWYIRTGIRFKI